jgi:hypothetical protein
MPQAESQPHAPARLHFREQEASALLDPIRIELRRLEGRLDHYLERLILSDDNTAALSRAREAIGEAVSRIETLQTEAGAE